MILLMVSDTPESKGLPSVQKLTGDASEDRIDAYQGVA